MLDVVDLGFSYNRLQRSILWARGRRGMGEKPAAPRGGMGARARPAGNGDKEPGFEHNLE